MSHSPNNIQAYIVPPVFESGESNYVNGLPPNVVVECLHRPRPQTPLKDKFFLGLAGTLSSISRSSSPLGRMGNQNITSDLARTLSFHRHACAPGHPARKYFLRDALEPLLEVCTSSPPFLRLGSKNPQLYLMRTLSLALHGRCACEPGVNSAKRESKKDQGGRWSMVNVKGF